MILMIVELTRENVLRIENRNKKSKIHHVFLRHAKASIVICNDIKVLCISSSRRMWNIKYKQTHDTTTRVAVELLIVIE